MTAGSAALPSSGYYVSRTTGGDHLIFDAGRHGYLNGGHAHADALAVVLTTAGRPSARRSRHRDLHDGRAGCGTASGRRRCTTRSFSTDRLSPAARTVPLVLARGRPVPRLAVRERFRLRRRHPQRLSAESACESCPCAARHRLARCRPHPWSRRHRCNSGHLSGMFIRRGRRSRPIAASCSATPMAPAGQRSRRRRLTRPRSG